MPKNFLKQFLAGPRQEDPNSADAILQNLRGLRAQRLALTPRTESDWGLPDNPQPLDPAIHLLEQSLAAKRAFAFDARRRMDNANRERLEETTPWRREFPQDLGQATRTVPPPVRFPAPSAPQSEAIQQTPPMPGDRPAMAAMPQRERQSFADVIPQLLAAAGDVVSAHYGRGPTGYLGTVMGQQAGAREQTFRDQLQAATMQNQMAQQDYEDQWRRYGAQTAEGERAKEWGFRDKQGVLQKSMADAQAAGKKRELDMQQSLFNMQIAKMDPAAQATAMKGLYEQQFQAVNEVEDLDKLYNQPDPAIAKMAETDPARATLMQQIRNQAYANRKALLAHRAEEPSWFGKATGIRPAHWLDEAWKAILGGQ